MHHLAESPVPGSPIVLLTGQATKVRHPSTPSVDVGCAARQDKGVVAFLLQRAWDEQRGQALVEYALILFLIALVVVGILGAMGGGVSSMLSVVSSEFP